jgi:hypothetical protein
MNQTNRYTAEELRPEGFVFVQELSVSKAQNEQIGLVKLKKRLKNELRPR